MAGAGTRGGKRRRAGEDDTLRSKAGPAKKKRVALKGRGEDGLRDSASISELAKPYLLAVGRLLLDVLDTTWITGQNRAIDTTHVASFARHSGSMGCSVASLGTASYASVTPMTWNVYDAEIPPRGFG
ncbi:unnamed protein product [Clonostachys rosea f. rosea IK726]|uniref:Uncharacterized protein n=1 Tax=Clonostachys rosea f. rosea IK726 TaxID=1349383 RepID=A0ACA9UVN6_BIOOC|nr:unnamed protein product [Clonostachys rosea f. rosea IK726]